MTVHCDQNRLCFQLKDIFTSIWSGPFGLQFSALLHGASDGFAGWGFLLTRPSAVYRAGFTQAIAQKRRLYHLLVTIRGTVSGRDAITPLERLFICEEDNFGPDHVTYGDV